MKRFWTEVTVDNGTIRLDGRIVKTPGRMTLQAPTAALAEAIADEWRNVVDQIDPRTMPMTGLSNAAIERAPTAESIAAYGESDLLCYRAEEPPELAAREAAAWGPILDWAHGRYDIHFSVTSGIIHTAQPPETVARLGAAVHALDAFHRTALSQLVTISGSLVIGLMLMEQAATPEAAFDAAHLDELWQAENWGEDPLATDARNVRRVDFLNGARFLNLLG